MRKPVCVLILLLTAAACGGRSTTAPSSSRPDFLVKATTRTDGNISGATVTLVFYGNGAAAAASGTDQGTRATDSAGSASFTSLNDGWYSVNISWTVGQITRNHGALERHSGCLVAFFSNRTALAQCEAVKLPPSQTTSFVFDN